MSLFGFYLSTQELGVICLVLCLVLGVLLIKDSVLSEITLFTPYELSKINKVTSKLNSKRETNLVVTEKSNRVKTYSNLFRKSKVFPFDEGTRDEYVELIDRLNLHDENGYKRVPDEFYVQSCMNVLALISFSFGLFIFSKISGATILNAVGLFSLVLIPVVYKRPLSKLRKMKKQNIIEIDKDMIEFINMFYYRFSNQKREFDLADLIDSFLPLANEDMHRMLVRFQLDINGLGDENAINMLHRKYGDSIYVTSFCNVALGVLEKHPNAYVQLDGLFDRLNSVNRLRYKKMCERKHAKKKNAYMIILGIFCVEMLIFIVFQIMQI